VSSVISCSLISIKRKESWAWDNFSWRLENRRRWKEGKASELFYDSLEVWFDSAINVCVMKQW